MKFPNLVFVKRDKESDGSTYLIVGKNVQEISEQHKVITVGLYKLVRRVKVANQSRVL